MNTDSSSRGGRDGCRGDHDLVAARVVSMAIGARVRYSRAVFNNEHATEDYVTIPYRTGTYLVLDNDPERPAKDGNFRSGRVLDPPLRASGSHQVDATVLADVVNRIAEGGPELRRLLIVDLRQESHAFLDGRAVSWCADKDWSNVGQPPAWIARDEQCQLDKLAAAPDTLVYAVHKDADGDLQILGSRPFHVTRAETEEMVVERIQSRLAIS